MVDKELLQREEKPGVSPVLVIGAYPIVLLIGLGLYGSQGWGLARLQRTLTRARRHTARRPGAPSTREPAPVDSAQLSS